MPLELTLLIWSTTLFGLYVGVQSLLYRMQHGVEFAATGRYSATYRHPYG